VSLRLEGWAFMVRDAQDALLTMRNMPSGAVVALIPVSLADTVPRA
jgi:hypothetical protein